MSLSPSLILAEHNQTTLKGQKIHLFRHLSSILCRLCETIVWSDLEGSEKRRLKNLIADLSGELHKAHQAMQPVRHTPRHRQVQTHKTAKAAFRKR